MTAALGAAGAADTFAGRITDVGEAWAPQVLLVAEPDEDGLGVLDELGKELRGAGRCAVAVVSTTRAQATAGPNTAIVNQDGQLHLALPFLLVEGAAAGLPVRELEPLVEIMTQARAATDEQTPPAPEPEAWADGTDAAGSVLALLTADEPVTAVSATASVDTAARLDPIVAVPRVEYTHTVATPRREVTAAIRQRRRQADPQLDSDLRAWREQDTIRPRISVLGAVTVDAPGPVPDQRRRFHAELIVYLAQRGARGASAEQLTDALWPDQQVKDASRRVAAHELAELYLDAGDPTGARWAVQQAWLADPERGDDGPWHDIMRAAHAEGHTAELRNLLGELMRVREAEVPEDLAPVTYALLRKLLPDLLAASSSG